MKKSLTQNELNFIQEYLVNGNNAYQAYKKAYPKASDKTAKTNSNDVMQRPLIIEYLKTFKTQTEEQLKIDRDYLIRECLELIEFCKSEQKKDKGNWNKAIDTLSKLTNSYAPIKMDVKNETLIKFDFDLSSGEKTI